MAQLKDPDSMCLYGGVDTMVDHKGPNSAGMKNAVYDSDGMEVRQNVEGTSVVGGEAGSLASCERKMIASELEVAGLFQPVEIRNVAADGDGVDAVECILGLVGDLAVDCEER